MKSNYLAYRFAIAFALPALMLGKANGFAADSESATSPSSAWDPKHSIVLMVGVLKWKSGELESFSSKFRRYAQLLHALISAGVPKAQTSFLADSKATLPAILAQLRRSIANCPAGDTYVFYYCGHGWLEDNGKGYFANYDAGDKLESCLSMDTIVQEFDKGFKGSQVIFLADCCRAGQLEKVLKNSKFKYAVLTVATSAQDSTSNWTFTQALLDTLEDSLFVPAKAYT